MVEAPVGLLSFLQKPKTRSRRDKWVQLGNFPSIMINRMIELSDQLWLVVANRLLKILGQ